MFCRFFGRPPVHFPHRFCNRFGPTQSRPNALSRPSLRCRFDRYQQPRRRLAAPVKISLPRVLGLYPFERIGGWKFLVSEGSRNSFDRVRARGGRCRLSGRSVSPICHRRSSGGLGKQCFGPAAESASNSQGSNLSAACPCIYEEQARERLINSSFSKDHAKLPTFIMTAYSHPTTFPICLASPAVRLYGFSILTER